MEKYKKQRRKVRVPVADGPAPRFRYPRAQISTLSAAKISFFFVIEMAP
jgi:hypothetical protein